MIGAWIIIWERRCGLHFLSDFAGTVHLQQVGLEVIVILATCEHVDVPCWVGHFRGSTSRGLASHADMPTAAMKRIKDFSRVVAFQSLPFMHVRTVLSRHIPPPPTIATFYPPFAPFWGRFSLHKLLWTALFSSYDPCWGGFGLVTKCDNNNTGWQRIQT